MITELTLALALAAAPAQVDDDPPVPTEEQVEAAVSAIEAALEDKDLEAAVAAVRAAQEVPAEDVTEAVAEAARMEEAEIALTALDVLGRIGHESAVTQLKRVHKKGKKRLENDEAWAIELYRSMGRTGSTDLIDAIGKDSLDKSTLKVDRARLLALGKIRDVESVETVYGLMNKVRPRDRQTFMDPFRASMAALTGQDAGAGMPPWEAWWNDNKRSLELPEEEPEIEAKKIRMVWEGFWKAKKPGKKNGDDDGDDPRGGDGR